MRATAYQKFPEDVKKCSDLPPGLSYIFLMRRSEEDGGNWKPAWMLPVNYDISHPARHLGYASSYWNGWPCSAEDMQEALSYDYGLAVLPEKSGIIIIDCDVKQEFVIRADGSAGLEITENGEQDLQKLLAELGLADLRTYTVRTPSGGVHYYFRHPAKEEFPEPIRSTGHRKGWYADIKASANVWAVAPPTAGYVPAPADIAEVPYRLAYYLRNVVRRLPARDGQRPRCGVRAGRAGILQAISAASGTSGSGWNSLIFWAACRYGEEGIADEEALRELTEAACPWNEGERRRAERTIRSGLRTGRREGAAA